MINTSQTDTEITQPTERIERKFFVIPANIGLAYAVLRQCCRPDDDYPDEQINSLYFDTGDLDQYERSSSGEWRKGKVRIRWYHTLASYREEVPVYAELKSREGFCSRKQRRRMITPVTRLETVNLHNGIIAGSILADTIAGFGHYPREPLRPIIIISYRRYRFTEINTGMRVTLDYNIRSTIVDRSLGYGEKELSLAGGVIEVKGRRMELPFTLRRMKLLDVDWSRFSKYSACLDTHILEPGDISNRWPSGRFADF